MSNENFFRRQPVFDFLAAHDIEYTVYEHPEAPTIEIARQYWRQDGSKHCKNLFFRNHKGNRHYLVVFDSEQSMAIHDLEHRLRQGKLSFASEQRMEKWLGLRPGSVSPFGLVNDTENHVHLFLDANLLKLLSATIVAIFLAIPYWKRQFQEKHIRKIKGGKVNA